MTTCKHPWIQVLAIGCLAGGLAFATATASAALLAYEGFDYERRQWDQHLDAEGIGGLDGGIGWAGPWRETSTLMSGIAAEPRDVSDEDGQSVGARTSALSYTDEEGRRLVTEGGQIRTATATNSRAERQFESPIGGPGETVWMSYLAQAAEPFDARWSFVKLHDEDGLRGVRSGHINPSDSPTWGYQTSLEWGVPGPQIDEPTFAVLKIDFPEDAGEEATGSIWWNPGLGDESDLGEPATFSAENEPYYGVTVRGRVSVDFDEIRIGTSFNSVTPHAPFTEDLEIDRATTVIFDTEPGKEYQVLRSDVELLSAPHAGDGDPGEFHFPFVEAPGLLRVVETSVMHEPETGTEPELPEIDGLQLHLDASAADTLDLDGIRVEEWHDARNGDIVFEPTETDADTRPVFSESGPNNRPMLLFDEHSLDTTSPEGLALANDVEGITFFSAVRNFQDGAQNIFRLSTESSEVGIRFVQHRVTNEHRMAVRRLDTDDLNTLGGGDRETGEWGIDSSVVDYLNAGAFLFRNGDQVASSIGFHDPGRSQAADSMRVRVGSDTRTPPENTWQGDIAEILYFDRALTREERNEIGIYLSDKYDIPYKLDTENDIEFDIVSTVTLTFRTEGDKSYRIETTEDLDGEWTEFGDEFAGSGFPERRFVTIENDRKGEFFRVRIID